MRGAAHGDELAYLFDGWSIMSPGAAVTDEQRAVGRMMRSCWTSFARTGEPKCHGAPDWPRYRPGADRLMELDQSPQLMERFRKPQLDAQEAGRSEQTARIRQSVERWVASLPQAPRPE